MHNNPRIRALTLKGSISLTERIKRLVIKPLIGVSVLVFAFVFTSNTAFAITHPFRYSPSDSYNITSDDTTYQNTYFDTVGMQYWTKKTGSNFSQLNATWITGSFITIFMESSASPLYNQFYVYGSSTHPNMSNSSFQNPDLINSFSVSGRTISQYRIYTQPGVTLTDFTINTGFLTYGTSTTPNTRIYMVFSGAPTITVNSEATLISLQQSVGCPGCAPSLDWIGSDGGLGLDSAPVNLSASSSLQACGITDIGGCISNAGVYLFAPNQTAVDKLRNITLASSSPFSYAYDIPILYNELFTQTSTSTLTISASTSIGVITFISPAMINAVPYVGLIRNIFTWLIWLFLAQTIYYMILNMYHSEHKK